jgi:hypothetical protein
MMKVFIYWGLNRDGSKDLIAIFANQPTINETSVFSAKNPHYDFLLMAYEVIANQETETWMK